MITQYFSDRMYSVVVVVVVGAVERLIQIMTGLGFDPVEIEVGFDRIIHPLIEPVVVVAVEVDRTDSTLAAALVEVGVLIPLLLQIVPR